MTFQKRYSKTTHCVGLFNENYTEVVLWLSGKITEHLEANNFVIIGWLIVIICWMKPNLENTDAWHYCLMSYLHNNGYAVLITEW